MSDMTTSPVVAVSEPQPIKTVVMTLPENPQGFRLSSEQCCNRYRVKPGMTIFKYRHAGPRAGIHSNDSSEGCTGLRPAEFHGVPEMDTAVRRFGVRQNDEGSGL